MRSSINSLESLDKEIHRLRTRTKELEKQIDERLDYVQDNYSSMMMKSFLPGIIQKSGIAGSVLSIVFQNKRLQDAFGKLATQLFDKVSDGVEFIVNKLEKKTMDDRP